MGSGSSKPKKVQKGCCETETEIPSSIMEREKFCDVNSEGRKVTDAFCCLIFLIFMIVWTFVAILAFARGDYRNLIYARDLQVDYFL